MVARTDYRIPRERVEWSTLVLMIGCTIIWGAAAMLYAAAPVLSVILLALTIALHSSLQHEAIHYHPTAHARVNEALVTLPFGLLVPYRRYRQLHLAHHVDASLTDPFDDPESYYMAFCDWERLPGWLRTVLDWNNRLTVRVVIGPAITAIGFLLSEAKLMTAADPQRRRDVRRAWALHGIGLVVVVAFVHNLATMPLWAYLVGAYIGMSLLSIRAFCEHRWAEHPDQRTVIVENSMLSLLFLNNNLHLVHHKHPGVPWYELPSVYRAGRAKWQAANGGYVFNGYGAVLRHFGLRSKGPVAHPVRTIR